MKTLEEIEETEKTARRLAREEVVKAMRLIVDELNANGVDGAITDAIATALQRTVEAK